MQTITPSHKLSDDSSILSIDPFMRGGKPKSLSLVMHRLMKELDAGSKLGEATIVSAWQDVSGPQIANVTEKAWVEKKRLFVKISSAPWRFELHLQRREWCERVNQQLGKRMIDEVIFR